MRARPFVADILADLEFAQTADHRRSDDERHKKRGQACKGRAEGQIAKDPERSHIKVAKNVFVQKPIEQWVLNLFAGLYLR